MTDLALLPLSALLAHAAPDAAAATSTEPEPPLPSPADLPPDPTTLERWQDARFGLFVHWGLYALLEGAWDEGDFAGTHHAEWIRTTARIPRERYDALVPRFAAPAFDAAAWARAAKDAGMGYVVVTSKHHDGFCLFDSARTEFDVGSAPFEGDAMADIAEAFRAEGMMVGWYHSILDWHHPDYLPRISWEAEPWRTEPPDPARFRRYLHAQVEELLTNYGPVDVMWFDGEWEPTWTHEDGLALFRRVRETSPRTLVNNRVDKGRQGMAGLTSDPEQFAGDFGTPEQEVPELVGWRRYLPDYVVPLEPEADVQPWESCITMNDHWGWNAADEHWKSEDELIRLLIDVASRGGNLLLNVGPKPDGSFPEEALERLAAIGDWMDGRAESIVGTEAGPRLADENLRCTFRPATDVDFARLYVHVLDWPENGRILLPGVEAQGDTGNWVYRAFRLTGGQTETVSVRQTRRGLQLDASAVGAPHPAAEVIAIEIVRAPVVHPRPMIDGPTTVLVGEPFVARVVADVPVAVRYTDAVPWFTSTSPPQDRIVARRPDGRPVRPAPTVRPPADDRAVSEVAFTGIEEPGTITVVASPVPAIRLQVGGAMVGNGPPRPSCEIEVVAPRPPDHAERPAGPAGLERTVWHRDVESLPTAADLAAWTPDHRDVAGMIDGAVPGRERGYVQRLAGFVHVDRDAIHVVRLVSDDGARVSIGGRVVVDDDGLHAARAADGVVALAAGWHAIEILHFNGPGDRALAVSMGPRGGALVTLDHERLVAAPANARATPAGDRPPRD